MKHFLILLAVFLWSHSAQAQKLIFNQKAPAIVIEEYIVQGEIAKNKASFISFFVLGNTSNEEDLKKIYQTAIKYKDLVNFIVIAKGDKEALIDYFKDKANNPVVVILDKKGKTFDLYGINYVPAAIITNTKGDFVWSGKPSALTEQLIEKYK